MYSCVNIVILNYRTWEDTIECIESVLKSDYKNYKIIVVDNASSNDSLKKIQMWLNGKLDYIINTNEELKDYVFPLEKKPLKYIVINETDIINKNIDDKEIILIQANKNNGFAAGNNIGIKFAQQQDDFQYLWLLNNDTVIKNDTLTKLVSTYDEYSTTKSIGILGSKLYYYNYPEEIQGLGAMFNKYKASIRVLRTCNAQNNNKILQVDYAIGASMFTNKLFIEKIGLMNEEYFLYYEELDWSLRAKKLNLLTYTALNSIVFHKQGKSTGTGQKHKNKNLLIERFKYSNLLKIYRNFFPSLLFIAKLAIMLKLIKKVVSKNFDEVKMIYKLLKYGEHN